MSDHVIKGDIIVYGVLARCLFDLGSSHSFISPSFGSKLSVNPIVMDVVLLVETSLGGLKRPCTKTVPFK